MNGWGRAIVATVLSVGLALSLGSCSLSAEKLEFSRAEDSVRKGDFDGALTHFKRIIDRNPKSELALKSAKESARITHYELKKYKEAVGFYKNLVLYSNSNEERIDAQKKIADLHFNQTLDYQQAITEYSRLLELPHTNDEDLAYRLTLARAYFYVSNTYQAQVEIDSILKRDSQKEDVVFEALLLKANIFLTAKKSEDAIGVLNELVKKYPERSKTESIGLILAVTYEEQKNFAKAIETLESIRESYPRKAFIEQKIKTLRERQTYLPGARGLKK